MVSADESRPETGPGPISGRAKASRNKPPGKGGEQRPRKASQDRPSQNKQSLSEQVQKPEPTPDALLAATETIPDAAQPMEQPVAAAETRDAAAEIVAEPATPADPAPVSVRAITDAYSDYTRKSIEQTSSFFQQLAGTRSLGAVLELQTQFVRSTFETFVDESRKIRELHRELARQRLQSVEGFMMGRRDKP